MSIAVRDMSRLRIGVASAIVGVWVVVCIAAIVNTDLVSLATVTTPALLAVAGWLYAGDYLNRINRRDDGSDDK